MKKSRIRKSRLILLNKEKAFSYKEKVFSFGLNNICSFFLNLSYELQLHQAINCHR
jgi:hypothetical protein